MRNRLWMALLVIAVMVTARPAAQMAKRGWLNWTAASVWDDCRLSPEAAGPGEACGWLSLPQADISQLVLNGASPERLSRAPCMETVGWSTLIMGHRDTHFMGLEQVEPGGVIHLQQRGGIERTYQCLETVIVQKEKVEALIGSYRNEEHLLLLTCYPFQYIGSAPERFLVVAKIGEDSG